MAGLLPGFRFYPTEEELIDFYLLKKLHGPTPEFDPVIPSIEIYNFEPSELPRLAGELCHGDTEQWFFFVPQQEREARGGRPNRTTATGYWKATGSTSLVYSSQTKIGVKKTMVFYQGKAPTGRKTKWKMNEYKAIVQEDTNVVNNTNNASSSRSTTPKLKHEMSLCRVYVTSGCARAFDRRPMPGATTTTTLNTSANTQNEDATTTTTLNTSANTQNEDIRSQVEQGIISGREKLITTGEKSNSSTTTHYYTDNSSNSRVHGQPGTHPEEGISNDINNDIHISDYSFMDWDL